MDAPETISAEEYREQVAKVVRPKFGNKRVKVDGYVFDSKAEAAHYEQLAAAERGGAISGLRVHPRYRLEVNGRKVCDYEADFAYEDADGAHVVDVKSTATRTPVYRLKRALMWACLGIEVEEVEV